MCLPKTFTWTFLFLCFFVAIGWSDADCNPQSISRAIGRICAKRSAGYKQARAIERGHGQHTDSDDDAPGMDFMKEIEHSKAQITGDAPTASTIDENKDNKRHSFRPVYRRTRHNTKHFNNLVKTCCSIGGCSWEDTEWVCNEQVNS